ncbi:sensor histidine kinase [Patescibacteria group bacterium]
MNLQNTKIGTLLGIGTAGIIIVMISTTIYSNYLSNSAQQIIGNSTTRIFDVMTIQRDVEELFSALDDLIVIVYQRELDNAEDRVTSLFERAQKTAREGREKEIFNQSELEQTEEVLQDVSGISARIFELKSSLIEEGLEYGGVYRGDSDQRAVELNREFDELRRMKYGMLGVVNDVIIRSDNEFREAMSLVQRAQVITWIVVVISLALAIILAYFIVKFGKKIYEIKNEFINIIAHDLRNPVTAIIGYLDIIKTTKEGSKKDLNKNIGIIHASTLKLRSQINNLLEVGRSETGSLKIELEPVVLSDVLNESVARAKAIAMTSGMIIDYKENTNLPKVIAEKNKLTDVIDNLISNALKYNRAKGTVTIESSKKGGKVNISVSDTGYGIPESEKDKIFKKYSRLEGKSKKKRGTGLGLYTAYMLVEKMGGVISFSSEENKGTIFTVSLKPSK